MPELFRMESVSHIFLDGFQGLKNIDFSMSDGECVLVSGRNGSGKSIFARHLVALLRPSSGTVYFKGSPIGKNLKRLRSTVGYVFQDTDSQILGQTVEEDVAFAPSHSSCSVEEIDRTVKASLDAVHLAGFESRRPETLSGGEKRRLAIAGVLAMEPECLILDEPFANLDYESVIEVLAICAKLKSQGKSIIVVTHELEKIFDLADRLVILDSGEKAFDSQPVQATPKTFLSHGLACPYEGYWPWSIPRTPIESPFDRND
jgi:biotin transport system ATP-binding protein